MLVLASALLCAVAAVATLSPVASASTGNCGLASPAFCETFDARNPRGDRAGALNGVVWGVSRASTGTNNGQNLLDNWSASQLQACGATLLVAAPELDDVICNGQMAESLDDNEN